MALDSVLDKVECVVVHCSLMVSETHWQFLGVHRIVIFTIQPDTGFAGYLKNIRPDSPDILVNLNTRMSSKKDQIHLSTSYICQMRNYL